MTLHTQMAILGPIEPEGLWAVVLDAVARTSDRDPDSIEVEIDPESWRGSPWVETQTLPMQGLCAWTSMKLPVGGPADPWERWRDAADDDSPKEVYALVSWDTAYGYTDETYGGCGALHRHLSARLGSWLDAQGVDWTAYDEYVGEWAKAPQPQSRAGG